MKKAIIFFSIIILLIISNKEYKKIIIPNEAIRIRVIANSNSLEDQLLKFKVKDNITKHLYNNIQDINNIDDARKNIKSSLRDIESIVSKTLNNNDYKINYGNNYFPKKELNGLSYEEGNYESLVINIGSGKGNNWWCVLFPPLCMIEGTYKESNNIEYKSKVLEILNRYK